MVRRQRSIEQPAPEMDVTTLIDVMFMLLIYFLTTSLGDAHSNNPPESLTSNSKLTSSCLVISVDAASTDSAESWRYSLSEGEWLTLHELESATRDFLTADYKDMVALRADRGCPWPAVWNAVELVQKLNARLDVTLEVSRKEKQ